MSFRGKVLADGQLPSSKSTLYEVPTGKCAYIKFFSVLNIGTDDQTVKIYINVSGQSRRIANIALSQNQFDYAVEKNDGLTLQAGCKIEGDSTDALQVDYVISGVEETL